MWRKAGILLVLSIIVSMSLSVWWTLQVKPWRSPQEVLADFKNPTGVRAEDMLADPLILAGDKVLPLILEEVKNPEMRLRRYAIFFLGNGRFRDALSVLETIVINDFESDIARGEALGSIYQIDPQLAERYAHQYVSRSDYLGKMAKAVMGERAYFMYLPERRSYLKALRGAHD